MTSIALKLDRKYLIALLNASLNCAPLRLERLLVSARMAKKQKSPVARAFVLLRGEKNA